MKTDFKFIYQEGVYLVVAKHIGAGARWLKSHPSQLMIMLLWYYFPAAAVTNHHHKYSDLKQQNFFSFTVLESSSRK